MRRICHNAISFLQISRGDILFNQGERQVTPTMYFLSAGSLQYHQESSRPMTVMKGWIAEPAMWLQWYHAGSARAYTETVFMVLNAETLHDDVRQLIPPEDCPCKIY